MIQPCLINHVQSSLDGIIYLSYQHLKCRRNTKRRRVAEGNVSMKRISLESFSIFLCRVWSAVIRLISTLDRLIRSRSNSNIIAKAPVGRGNGAPRGRGSNKSRATSKDQYETTKAKGSGGKPIKSNGKPNKFRSSAASGNPAHKTHKMSMMNEAKHTVRVGFSNSLTYRKMPIQFVKSVEIYDPNAFMKKLKNLTLNEEKPDESLEGEDSSIAIYPSESFLADDELEVTVEEVSQPIESLSENLQTMSDTAGIQDFSDSKDSGESDDLEEESENLSDSDVNIANAAVQREAYSDSDSSPDESISDLSDAYFDEDNLEILMAENSSDSESGVTLSDSDDYSEEDEEDYDEEDDQSQDQDQDNSEVDQYFVDCLSGMAFREFGGPDDISLEEVQDTLEPLGFSKNQTRKNLAKLGHLSEESDLDDLDQIIAASHEAGDNLDSDDPYNMDDYDDEDMPYGYADEDGLQDLLKSGKNWTGGQEQFLYPDRIQTDRPKKFKKSRPPDFGVEGELKDYLVEQWLKSRESKRLKKAEREKLRAQGKLGRRGRKDRNPDAIHDLFDKYEDQMTVDQCVLELDQFLHDSPSNVLFFPPLDNNANWIIKQLVKAYYMKAQVQNNCVLATRTRKTVGIVDINTVQKFLGRRKLFPRIDKKLEKTFTRGPRRERTPKMWIAEGHIVGEAAEEISNDNIGHQLLTKMGWKQGSGLGHELRTGISEPVMARVKKSKSGLGA